MKNWVGILVWAMCALVCTAEAALWDSLHITRSRQVEHAPMIRALIVNDVPNVLLEARGKYVILDADGHNLASRVHGKKKLIKATLTGLVWGEEFPDRFKITLIPTSGDSILIVNETPYRGSLTIQAFKEGTLSIVNTVDVEQYLASLLGMQIEDNYPPEALNAVAIAERTHVYNQTLQPRNDHWDVDASKTGYAGVGEFSQGTELGKALAATRYMVLGRSGGSLDDVELVPVKWELEGNRRGVLSLAEAAKEARNGRHAGQILRQVAPNAAIVRVYP